MKYKMYINGEWTDAVSGEYYDDMNPYTGEVYAQVANGGSADVKKAVDAAYAAFPAWRDYPATERRKILFKAAEILDEKGNELFRALQLETGATMVVAGIQKGVVPETFREAAAEVFDVHGEIFPSDDPGVVNMMWRQPLGVVASISPWNAAGILGAQALANPLAAGNTVVFKTSEASSVAGGLMLVQALDEAGIPKGVVNIVTSGPGRSAEIGDALTSDSRVRCLKFVGSSATGKRLGVQCANTYKKFISELGGNDPLIILNDADIDYAVEAASFGRYIHQGQVCMNAKRMIVEEGVAEEFLEKMTNKAKSLKFGSPMEPGVVIGPLINQGQMDKLLTQIDRAKEQGAKILCGGKNHGLVYEPTVLLMTEEMDIFQEEVFGPVANVIIAKDAEDALRIANNSEYGLSSGIITKDITKAWQMAERIESGGCHINDSGMNLYCHAPLGGMKASGSGRSGFRSTEEFTEVRWVSMRKNKRKYPF
ncbi:MAG: aldehyde dehydrogenase family protein [Lachnospiraceae bacterium]|nr:aldehyde dehydrogenase family protein [Lachnospiraceae bacterium]